MKLFIVLAIYLGLAGFSSSAEAAQSDPCTFDHQILTLSPYKYNKLVEFFAGPVGNALGIAYFPDQLNPKKSFAYFPDSTYIELWQSDDPTATFGFQDACRVEKIDTLSKISQLIGIPIVDYRQYNIELISLGRSGPVGDPYGGMFYEWQPGRSIDLSKSGIRQILKSVASDSSGRANPEHVHDYRVGGLEVEFIHGETAYLAVDRLNIQRVGVGVKSKEDIALIAVRISYQGSQAGRIPIELDPNGYMTMYADVTPTSVTLVFRADLYEMHSSLLQ